MKTYFFILLMHIQKSFKFTISTSKMFTFSKIRVLNSYKNTKKKYYLINSKYAHLIVNVYKFAFRNWFKQTLKFDVSIITIDVKLIATNQKLEKNQKFDSKKSNQVENVKFEICFDVKFKILILMSNSNSNRHIRFEVCFDVKSSFFLEFEIWFEKFDLIWNTIDTK